jgi:hypothetical protein
MKERGRSYNYARFTPGEYQLDKFPGPRPGSVAGDLTATTLDGEPLRLSDLRGRTVVLETGSVTCPQYVGRIPAMNRMAAKHPDVVFVLLYVREAHPGRGIVAHGSVEDKIAAARLLRSLEPERRVIAIDDLEGSAHRAYGSLPNIVYISDQNGTVLFRGDWNDPKAVDAVLSSHDDRMPGEMVTHFRPVSPGVLFRVLSRAGREAVTDFFTAIPRLALTHLKNKAQRHTRRDHLSTR